MAVLSFVSFFVPLTSSPLVRSLGFAASIDRAFTPSIFGISMDSASPSVASSFCSAALRRSRATSPAIFSARPLSPSPNLSKDDAALATISPESPAGSEGGSAGIGFDFCCCCTCCCRCCCICALAGVSDASFVSNWLSFWRSSLFSISSSSNPRVDRVCCCCLACCFLAACVGVSGRLSRVCFASFAASLKSSRILFKPFSMTARLAWASLRSCCEAWPRLTSASSFLTLAVCFTVAEALMFSRASRSNRRQNKPRFFPLPLLVAAVFSAFLFSYVACSCAVGCMLASLTQNGWLRASSVLMRALLLRRLPKNPRVDPLSVSNLDARSNPIPPSMSSTANSESGMPRCVFLHIFKSYRARFKAMLKFLRPWSLLSAGSASCIRMIPTL
mmetsp:Transcript_8074/g.15809  ORF Transcript_8074/g.15809 Transcript_8074/m.15809 type:complete len:389 (-) Transcript_8074:1212-2378(-)